MLTASATLSSNLGVVSFSQDSITSPVGVTITVNNVADGYHGIHIHADPNGEEGHFHVGEPWSPDNEDGTPHGDGFSSFCHTGDMCNNIFVLGGTGTYQYSDAKISIFPGLRNIIGRSVVLHAGPDDYGLGPNALTSLVSGSARDRLGIGLIVRGEDSDGNEV